ncbi:MAG: hypothetical protein ACT4OW_03765, partial [Nitrososphaerota archaeon]
SMSTRTFMEFVINDLKQISADLKGFVEVYYPMLKASWNPENEHDFILGWFIGSKEQEYSTSFYEKYGKRMYHELLFEVQREISQHKTELHKIIMDYLEKKEQ